MLGRDGQRLAQAQATRLRRAATRRPGPRTCWRAAAPACSAGAARRRDPGRPAVMPPRASTTNRPTSASARPCIACQRSRPARLSGEPCSRPAVSITRNSVGPSRQTPSIRSRVTPGVSSTIACRRPTSRLNRVDLPTFGRPRIATVGELTASPERDQLGVVGQEEHRAVGDGRRHGHARRRSRRCPGSRR